MSDDKTHFETWPPLMDETIRDKVKKLIQIDDQSKIKGIEIYYDSLTAEINKAISEQKKKTIIDSTRISNFKNCIIKSYQTHSSVSEIQEFLNKDTEISQLEKNISSIIDSRYEKSKEYSVFLKNMLDYYEQVNVLSEKQRIFDLEKIKEIITNIKFFQPNELAEEYSNEELNNQFNKSETFLKMQSNVFKQTLDLKTKVNNLQKQIENDFCISSELFNKQYLDNQDQCFQSILDNFIPEDDLRAKNQILKLLPLLLNLGMHFKDPSKRRKISQMISELINVEINFEPKLIFYFSQFCNSQKYLKSEYEDDFSTTIEIHNSNYCVTSIYGYLNKTLRSSHQTIIRLKLFLDSKSKFYVGLIKSNSIDSQDIIQSAGFSNSITGRSIFSESQIQIIQGKYFLSDMQDGEIEILVDIKNKIIRYHDYPTKNNIIQMNFNSKQLIDLNSYYFCIGFDNSSSQGTKLSVTYFQQIQNDQ